MDIVVVGKFLAHLRKKEGLSQEKLGEMIGVTNKTVSRWETGKYLPPVDVLEQLSNLYGITINEIISGKRLTEEEYRQSAEENIKFALNASSFTLKEKIDYFKKKWKKDHTVNLIIEAIVIIAVFIIGIVLNNGLQIIGMMAGIGWIIVKYNQMMAYVENRAFDGND